MRKRHIKKGSQSLRKSGRLFLETPEAQTLDVDCRNPFVNQVVCFSQEDFQNG